VGPVSDHPWRRDRPVHSATAAPCASPSAGMMTFVGIAYLLPSAESPGARSGESLSCTTDATSTRIRCRARSARRHVLRVEQPLVDADRSTKPHAVAEARLLRFGLTHDTPCG